MLTKIKLPTKMLAVLLTMLMVISVVPMQSFAAEVKNKAYSESVDSISDNDKIIKREILEKRNDYSRTYLLEDGTYCTLSFFEPIGDDNQVDLSKKTVNEIASKLQSDCINNRGITVGKSYTGTTNPTATLRAVDDNDSIVYNTITLDDSNFGVININNVLDTINNYNKSNATINVKIFLNCTGVTSENTISIRPIKTLLDNNSSLFDQLDNEWANNDIIDYNTIDISGRYVWDVTSEYIKMENGTIENGGFLLTNDSYTPVTFSVGYIERIYRVIDEQDFGFSYHEVDMGRAGIVYINDYTNTLLLKRDEVGIDGNILPVFITRYIDNIDINKSFGSGGRWNYDCKLAYEGNSFIWNMLDGQSAKFQVCVGETDAQNRQKWEAHGYNSEDYVLWVNTNLSNSFDYSNNIIIDEDGYVYKFNEYGKLVTIESPYNINDQLNVCYYGDTIDYITDGVGRKYDFVIDPISGAVTSIIVKKNDNSIGVGLSYEYDTNLNLKKVIYPDNLFVEYSYDNIGRLSEIVNINGDKLIVDYYIPTSKAQNSNNPVYRNRVSGYTKMVLTSSTVEPYITDFAVEIDSDYAYRRVFNQTNRIGNSVISEALQFSRNLDTLYVTQLPMNNSLYACYSDENELLSIVVPENANNLIINGNLNETNRGGKSPKNWTTHNVSTLSSSTDISIPLHEVSSLDKYVLINNSVSINRMLSQDIPLSGLAGGKYVIKGSGIGNATIPREGHFWGIRILAKKNDNSVSTIHHMEFDASIPNEWQTRATAFEVPSDVVSLTVQIISAYQLGSVGFDSIELYKTDSAFFVNQNANSSSNTGCSCSFCTNSNCNCSCTDENLCNCVSCHLTNNETRDSHGNITNEVFSNIVNSIINSNEYTTDANYLSKITDENGIQKLYNYDIANGKLLSTQLASDATTLYAYNAIGYLTSVSQTINNAINNTSVTAITQYSYNEDKLQSITHNGFSYMYEYDDYGDLVSIKVNNSPLVSYSYVDDYYGNIGTISYANGTVLSYTYDERGNITEIEIVKTDNQTNQVVSTMLYEYEYDDYNKLISYTDYQNSTVTYYDKTVTDNNLEKTYSIIVETIDNHSVLYSMSYNSENEIAESIFGYDYTITQTTEENALYGTTTFSKSMPILFRNSNYESEFNETRDCFDRKLSEELICRPAQNNNETNGYTVTIENNYTYKTISDSQTTRLVDTYIVSLTKEYNEVDQNNDIIPVIDTTEVLNIKYDYDSAGRITVIYRYDNDLATPNYVPSMLYEYDDAGQLIAEISFDSLEARQYTYDAGGNIICKKTYENVVVSGVNGALSVSSYGVLVDTINYQYDPLWKDLLTSYNGTTINYDDLGNPTNYVGHSIDGSEVSADLEWNGKNLVSATTNDGDNYYEYTYDASGLRIGKSIYDKITYINSLEEEEFQYVKKGNIEYIWNDGVIVGYRIITYKIIEDENDGSMLFDDVTGEILTSEENVMVIKPIYDSTYSLMGVNCIDEKGGQILSGNYLFIKDNQGNIRGIVNEGNEYEISFNYDGFGNFGVGLTGATMDELNQLMQNTSNAFEQAIIAIASGLIIASIVGTTFSTTPFTYRGYLFDAELGLYYCRSRYYSPSWCRFISVDESLLTEVKMGNPLFANVFSYCHNDPTNQTDPSGEFPVGTIVAIVVAIVALVSISQVGGEYDKALKKHTQNVVDYGTNVNKKPKLKNYSGLSVYSGYIPDYKVRCQIDYNSMLTFELISRGVKWKSLSQKKKDELVGTMNIWSKWMYEKLFSYYAEKSVWSGWISAYL